MGQLYVPLIQNTGVELTEMDKEGRKGQILEFST